MGAFLHIGLRARLSASKPDSSEQTAELRQRIGNVIDLSIYEDQETDKQLIWSLKSDLLQRELVPFLQKQFSLIPDEYAIQQREVMLRDLQEVKTIVDLKNSCENTQSSVCHWNEYDSLTIGQGRLRQHIPVDLFVFKSEGKIIMEEYGGIFDYFETLIALSNPEFQLAKAACVSIV